MCRFHRRKTSHINFEEMWARVLNHDLCLRSGKTYRLLLKDEIFNPIFYVDFNLYIIHWKVSMIIFHYFCHKDLTCDHEDCQMVQDSVVGYLVPISTQDLCFCNKFYSDMLHFIKATLVTKTKLQWRLFALWYKKNISHNSIFG